MAAILFLNSHQAIQCPWLDLAAAVVEHPQPAYNEIILWQLCRPERPELALNQ
eukprot:COSAG06_NODE_46350_length_347_cov_1.250000_1_plen_52_part_10